jgi:hypothetical protein
MSNERPTVCDNPKDTRIKQVASIERDYELRYLKAVNPHQYGLLHLTCLPVLFGLGTPILAALPEPDQKWRRLLTMILTLTAALTSTSASSVAWFLGLRAIGRRGCQELLEQGRRKFAEAEQHKASPAGFSQIHDWFIEHIHVVEREPLQQFCVGPKHYKSDTVSK